MASPAAAQIDVIAVTPAEELEHERHVAEILRIRQSRPDEKSTLSTWLNSNVLTALIGVVGTALLGTWLTGIIQERTKNNELERRAQEVRLDSQNAAVNKVLERAGNFLSASDDLLVTVNNDYAEAGRPSHEIEPLRKWKADVTVRRDNADSEWRRERSSFGFTLQFVFGADKRVNDAWRNVVRAVDDFEICTNSWYTANAANGSSLTADKICPETRVAFEQAIEAFAAAAATARVTVP